MATPITAARKIVRNHSFAAKNKEHADMFGSSGLIRGKAREGTNETGIPFLNPRHAVS